MSIMSLRIFRILPVTIRCIVSYSNRKPTIKRFSVLSSNYSSTRIVVPARRFSSNSGMDATDPRRVFSYEDVLNVIEKSDTHFLIDVRTPDEVKETGQIPSSIHIPLANVESTLSLSTEDFEKQTNRKKPSNESEIVFYCHAGRRAERAVGLALQLGFKNSKQYLGSWSDWASKQKQ